MIEMPHVAETPSDLRKLFLEYVPDEFADAVRKHPRVEPAIQDAWDNGWRDAQWLAAMSVMGCKCDDPPDPVGLIVWQLMDAADEPCPTSLYDIRTPDEVTAGIVYPNPREDPDGWRRASLELKRRLDDHRAKVRNEIDTGTWDMESLTRDAARIEPTT